MSTPEQPGNPEGYVFSPAEQAENLLFEIAVPPYIRVLEHVAEALDRDDWESVKDAGLVTVLQSLGNALEKAPTSSNAAHDARRLGESTVTTYAALERAMERPRTLGFSENLTEEIETAHAEDLRAAREAFSAHVAALRESLLGIQEEQEKGRETP